MEAKSLLQPGEEKEIPLGKFIEVGLSWEMFGEKIDLDLSAILLTNTGQMLDAVYFNQTASKDGSVIHSGDEKTGKKEGYDEKITIFLDKIGNGTSLIAILVNSSSGQSFQKVETAELSISIDQQPLISMNCGWKGDFESILSAFIYKTDESSSWKIKNIGETGHHHNFLDSLPLIISNMKFLTDEDTLKESEQWNAQTGKSYNLKKRR